MTAPALDAVASALGAAAPVLGAVDEDIAQVFVSFGALVIVLALLARAAHRVGLSPIPLYLVVGIVVGPGGVVEVAVDEAFIEIGAEIGVILLLFMLGLEYTGDELKENLRIGLPAGGVDLVLNLTPGVAAGLALGWDLTSALLLGGVTYISSSGVIAKALSDLGRLGNRETPAVLTTLVIEDLVMAVYLPLMAVLLLGTGMVTGLISLGVAIGAAAIVLVAAIRWGPAMSRVISTRNDEVLLLTVFGLILVVSGLAEQLQVSAAVGAFLVGIGLSEPVADRARELLEPLRDLFAATFFLFFGLQVDPTNIPGVAVLALALGAVTAVTKVATGWYAAGRLGAAAKGRARAGTALIARGEFSIVIAGLGVGLAHPQLAPLAAAYVLLLAIAGSIITRYADPLVDWVLARSGRRSVPAHPSGGDGGGEV